MTAHARLYCWVIMHLALRPTEAHPEASVPTAVPGDTASTAAEAGQAHGEAALDV